MILKKRYRLLFAILSAVFAILILAFSIGFFAGTEKRIARLVGSYPDPEETIAAYFDAVFSGDLRTAASLTEKGVLPSMEPTGADELELAVWGAFLESRSYSLAGDGVLTGDEYRETVSLTFLSPEALTDGLGEEVSDVLTRSVLTAIYPSEIYAEDGSYLPEVTSQAVAEAVSSRLISPERYYVTEETTVTLRYRRGAWYLLTDDSLWDILSGIETEGGK